MDSLLRTRVFARQDGCCAWCGQRLSAWPVDAWDAHHRQLRSRGGQDRLENLVALCHVDHMLIHRHPERAMRNGFMVSAYDDPAVCPIRLVRRLWVDPITFDPIEGELA